MCRWIAYSGVPRPLEHYVISQDHSLVEQSRRALQSTTGVNGDGFGLGWFGSHTEPGLFRDLRPAWSDENLRYLCRHLISHQYFAHVRAATGTAVTRQNCHPFACGRWLFMHNGFIGGWNRLRRRIEGLIPDDLYPSRLGTTDSEALFLAILGQGLNGTTMNNDPVSAAVSTLSTVCSILGREPFRFTSALANGDSIYAFRFAFNDRANTMYYRYAEGDLIVVSEPLDGRQDSWIEVPEDTVLVSKKGEEPELRQLTIQKPPLGSEFGAAQDVKQVPQGDYFEGRKKQSRNES